MRALAPICCVIVALISVVTAFGDEAVPNDATKATAAEVDYQRQIKPLLKHRCYACHGPLRQRGGLRLDTAAAIRKGGESGAALVAGNAADSLIVGVLSGEAGFRMPPQGEPLARDEIELFKRWIAAGAKAPADEKPDVDPHSHWSLQLVGRPTVPSADALPNAAWVGNPIDAFVAKAHREHELVPAPAASKQVLLRRVYLDLVGVPPTADQLGAFLADSSPDAYEKVVDRLLESDLHGQRWGRHWMDVWRYSDWYGRRGNDEIRYSARHIWHWRDWIVDAVNADKGYDRMIVEMLAADEAAPGDADALRATGFLARNWYKFNRTTWLQETVEHTSMGFLGLTFKCARCHDHKFDPVSQVEYYRFRAFFEPHEVRTDSLPGISDATQDGLACVYDAKPDAPTYLFQRGDDRYPDKENPLEPGVPEAFGGKLAIEPVELPPAAWYPAWREENRAGNLADAARKVQQTAAKVAAARQAVKDNAARLAEMKRPQKPKPKAVAFDGFLLDEFGKPRPDVWQFGHGNWQYIDGGLAEQDVTQWATIVTQKNHPADFRARVRYSTTAGGMYRSVGLAFDAVMPDAAAAPVDFQAVYTSARGQSIQAFHREASRETYPKPGIFSCPVPSGEPITIDIAVRGSLLNVWADGKLKMAYQMPKPRQAGRFALWVHSATAIFEELRIEALPAKFTMAKTSDGAITSPFGQQADTASAISQAIKRAESDIAAAEQELAVAQADEAALAARIDAETFKLTTPDDKDTWGTKALAATKAVRNAALLRAKLDFAGKQQALEQAKGALAAKPDDKATKAAAATKQKEFDAAKKAVDAATAALKKLDTNYGPLGKTYPQQSTGRRLALARWITDSANPRTARVAVNHIWLRHFGQPIVASVANFGLAGKPPSHPQLLDWLAAELVENGWSMKHLHRLIVTSNAYRMSSTMRKAGADAAANAARDADNRYLWRAVSRRMEAEVVRDSLLHLSGKLDASPGGPDLDVKKQATSTKRSMYFRVTPDDKLEFLELFDLANPNQCYRRQQSVVPQQALALSNSQLAVEQSRLIARKLAETAAADGDFVRTAFAHVLCRLPSEAEQAACVRFLDGQAKLLADTSKLTPFPPGPTSRIPPSAEPKHRARENLVHALFNHNEFVTIR